MPSQSILIANALYLLEELNLVESASDLVKALEAYYSKYPEDVAYFRYWTIEDVKSIAEFHYGITVSNETAIQILEEYEEYLDTDDQYKFIKELVEEFALQEELTPS